MRFAVRIAVRNAAAVFTSNRLTATRVEQLAGLTSGTVEVFPYGLPSGSRWPSHPGVSANSHCRRAPHARGCVQRDRCADLRLGSGISSVPDAQLEIVGDGPDRPRLTKMAEALGLNGSIRFAGRVSDEELRQAYGRATLFAMPGRHTFGPPAQGEGFGMVFVEAGAAGLPVVAGNAAGALDAVGHDETGLLVDPNDPREVADAIVRLLTDPELARRLGRGGQERAQGRFAYAAFKENVGALIQSTLDRKVD